MNRSVGTGKPVEVTEATFEAEVLKSPTPVLVDFWAEWCTPCKMMAPVLDQVASEQAGKLKVAKVDVDAYPAMLARFGIRGIPTLILFKNGQLVDRIIGYQSKSALLGKLQRHLA
jgi:thioredoxin 1